VPYENLPKLAGRSVNGFTMDPGYAPGLIINLPACDAPSHECGIEMNFSLE
jgi:hypothetical protein